MTPRPASPSRARSAQIRRVVAVDAHPVVRRGVAQIVAAASDLELVAEAGRRHDAQRLVTQHAPDLVVTGLALDGADGFELISWIQGNQVAVRVLVLSGRDPCVCGERALRAGALGFVGKDAAPDEILAAMRDVLAGRMHAPPALTGRIMRAMGGRRSSDPSGGGDDPIEQLSDRERQVFEAFGAGRSAREVAASLAISVKTVASHRANIQVKLGLASRAEFVRRAVLWVGDPGDGPSSASRRDLRPMQ